MSIRRLAAALLLLLAPRCALATTLYTVGADRLDGRITSMTADGQLEFAGPDGKVLVPLKKIYRIQMQDRAPARDPKAAVELLTVNGSHLYGRLAPCDQGVALASPALRNDVRFGLAALLGLRFLRGKGEALEPEKFAAAVAAARKQADTLYVGSEKGIVPFGVALNKIAPDAVAFSWEGTNRTMDTARVAAVVLANAASEERPQAQVTLVDASELCGTIVSFGDGRLTLQVCGADVLIPTANVIVIELACPDVAYLSDLEPAEVQEVPFFNHIWPHRANQSIGGHPLTLGGRAYARGIGCHTRTVLTYDLGGEYRKFVAVIGIDDEARPRGSVEFIVEADGRRLYAATLTGRDKPVPLALDLAGAKRLSPIADFAEDASVGDHADWADAMVLK